MEYIVEYNNIKLMTKLTPSKLVGIRRQLEPLANTYDIGVGELLKKFKAKFEEMGGLVDVDIIHQ